MRPAQVDIAVLGAGPAGIEAALAAAEAGLDVALLDEAAAPGGQVYRALPAGFSRIGPPSPEAAIGDALRERLKKSRVRSMMGRRVWLVTGSFRLDALGPLGPERIEAKALVAAIGTHERIIPFPGWTSPLVMGLAAATILLKSQQLLPGKRSIVAGCGPLLAAVAAGILKAGGDVAAVVDLSGRADWLKVVPGALSRPDLLARGAGWLAGLTKARVSILRRHTVARVEIVDRGIRAAVVPVDEDGRPVPGSAERFLDADCLLIGHGLVPSTELTRLLRAEHRFAPDRGGWVPALDAHGRTSVPGLYVAGDGAGLEGAAAAQHSGRLAGLAAALDQGALDSAQHGELARPAARQRERAARFGRAMARLTRPRPGLVAAMPSHTLVCRCEEVARAELEAAVARGAGGLDQLKAWTRCGMGPCQGRMCGEAAASLQAVAEGGRERAGMWTGRAPLRPVPLAELIGDYDYADIPIPAAAPL